MKQIYALLLTLTVSTFSFAQVNYLNDSFNYTDNSLLTANGWTAHSGAGTNAIDVGASNGLTYAGYNSGAGSITGFSAGNAAKVDNTGEDVNKLLTAAPGASSDVFVSFLINVTNATTGYFIHLSPTDTGTQVGRIFVRPSATNPTTTFNIGISNSSTGNFGTTEFTLNTTYLVIVKYNNSATGACSVWVKSSGIPANEAAAGAPEATATGSGSAAVDRICLRQFGATQNEIVDALYISSTWMGTTPCSLTLDVETAACNAVTLAIDTYNATIPFTGGNSGTYNLSTNVGTIGGDNPSTTATGNIVISNVPEGTNVTLTITGTCGITRVIVAPQCKPVNTLPYNEPFNYTVGNILTNEQRWSISNTGDNILATAGNLTYTGLTSTGNSIAFDGGGAEAHTPFTGITSGTLYSSFLMKVTDNTAVTEGGQTYFAVLTDGVSNNFKARIFSKKTGSTYQLGLTSGTSTTNYTSTFFNVNDVVYVVMGYDFATNTLKAWFNPTIASFTPATPADLTDTPAAPIATLGGFLLRQDSTNTTPFTTIDEVRVATTLNGILSVQENNISGLNVYPNPAKDFLHITTAANGVKTVSIYDLVGKQVLNTTTANEVIEISSLNAGVYMVKITEEGKTATRKLVIK
ncbi:MAG TPA: T9SS type A sorting domain-containing protein [Flavobacterium sp.]|uniref:T9SS type A sorting domain-containing protein n=1 Tax=Flavobacterium sp. TaxID=239 RepID=UPI002B8E6373|nr:T9SS type A sorting domain-containing protein [Flavobacterium sp.]HSD14147.1 T9SS type A sorting domain-containing protein [Flavobacterium sp.]